MKKLLCLILILLSTTCMADEAFIGYGVGVFNDADQFLGQNKYGELGYRHFLYKGIYWQGKGGFWGEGSSDQTRKAGFWASTGPGMEMSMDAIELRSGYGIAAISDPDSQLGAYFPQFDGELYVGLRDKQGDGVGFQYEHISCASFCSPNHGRDFLTVQLSLKW